MISKAEAITLAREWVKSQDTSCDVFPDKIVETNTHFLFRWNTIEYIKTQEIEKMGVGPGIITIAKNSGLLFHASSGLSRKKVIEALNFSDDPNSTPTRSIKLNSTTLPKGKFILLLRKHFSSLSLQHATSIYSSLLCDQFHILSCEDRLDASRISILLNQHGINCHQIWD